MDLSLRDQYLAALGLTQWVLRASPVPDFWQNIGGSGGAFAFVLDRAVSFADSLDPYAELLRKMMVAVGQDLASTGIYTSAAPQPDGLPIVVADHVIVFGHESLCSVAPPSYYFTSGLDRLLNDAALKRALWLAMKDMMGAHA